MTPQTIGSAAPTAQHPGCSTSNEAGWAMLPHSIAADARLTAVDIRVALALLYFARSKHTCTPCDQSIGERAGGISAGTVQRSLRRLEQCGYLRRQAVAPTDANRTGRVLHLLWRCSSTASTMRGQTEGAVPRDRMSDRRRVAPRSPARDKENVWPFTVVVPQMQVMYNRPP
jgi:hypothetical protein